MENGEYKKVQKLLTFIFGILLGIVLALIILYPPSNWYGIVMLGLMLFFPFISIIIIAIFYPKTVVFSDSEMELITHYNRRKKIDLKESRYESIKGRKVICYADTNGKERNINPNVFDSQIKSEIWKRMEL